MKVVQIGILVALVVVAGLLYVVYRGQSTQPAPVAPAATTAPAPAAPAEAVTPPAPAPAASEPASKKPSPAKRRAPTAVAESRPPESAPGPAAQAPTPAQAPAAEPAPAQAPAATRAPLTPPSGTQTTAPAPRTAQKVTVPAGTLLSVRLSETLASDKNQPGDTFTATLDQPLVVEGFVLAERGARLQGRILEVQQAGRVRGLASLTVHLVRLHTADGQEVPIQTEPFVKGGVSSKGEDAKKIGVGAAIGAAVGAIAGGGKGAAIGAGVGGAAGAGTVAATRGKPAVLPVETHINFRLQEPVTLTEKIR